MERNYTDDEGRKLKLVSIRIHFYGEWYSDVEEMDYFIVSELYPLVDSLGIEEYHTLFETLSNSENYRPYNHYIALRVKATFDDIMVILNHLDEHGMEYDVIPYCYEDDTYNRILRKGGIMDYLNKYHEGWSSRYIYADGKSYELAKMLRCVGKCSRILKDELGRIPRDSWMISVMVHLLLNSLGFSHEQERKIRDFEYI